jgi:uncharacterized protein
MTNEGYAVAEPDTTTESRPDTAHAGAQKVFFACFTEPAASTSIDQIRTHIPAHKEWLAQHEADFLVAGPFLDESFSYSGTGLIVIRAGSIAEATKIADSDPMHSSGARTFRIVPWQINEGTMTVAMTFSSGAFDFH